MEATGKVKVWTSAPVNGNSKCKRPEIESPESKEQGSGLHSQNRFGEGETGRKKGREGLF